MFDRTLNTCPGSTQSFWLLTCSYEPIFLEVMILSFIDYIFNNLCYFYNKSCQNK